MTLRLNGSSSGFTEIDAPAAAGSNRLILPTSNGTANQFLKNGSTAGTLEFGGLGSLDRVKRTYTAEQTIAVGATEIEFTSIPANFSQIRIIAHDIKFSGTNHLKVELGHAASGGTYLTTGYQSYFSSLGSTSNVGDPATDSFRVRIANSADEFHGYMELFPDKATSPTRLYEFHSFVRSTGTSQRIGAGYSPDISAFTIDRIRLKLSGSNTFNNGDGRISLITEVIE